jgi:hypothetical protein
LRRNGSFGALGSGFFTFGYTYGHELDNSSGFRERNSGVPAYHHNQFYASGDTDVRHTIVFSGGWNLPFDHLWQSGPKLLTRGWSLYPIFTWHTGFPLDVFAGTNTTLSRPSPSGEGDGGNVRADLVASNVPVFNPENNQNLTNPNSGTTSVGNFWFNPADFSDAKLLSLDTQARRNAASLPYFTYGSFGRNGIRGPGQTNLDIAISKHLLFGEGKYDMELRMDAFDALNHAEFANPDTTITDSTFGQISTTVVQGRILQLALHFQF